MAAGLAALVVAGLMGSRLLGDDAPSSKPSGLDGGAISEGVYFAAACRMPEAWARMLHRGWQPSPERDWDLAAVPRQPGWFGTFAGTSHSGPYDYLQQVPLVFYGSGFVSRPGTVDMRREVTLTDLPSTYAELMGFDFPRRAGRPLDGLFRDDAPSPKVIVTAIIDGGGWNVLRRWPDAWPNLARLMRDGASVSDAVVGSSPSITPAVHTSLSTGAWPRKHGVMAIAMRADDGQYVSGFASRAYAQDASKADPTINLDLTTLADEWDKASGNEALIAMVAPQTFHLGMLGHGSALEGGDKDIAAMIEDERWATNPRFFDLPSYVNDPRVVQGPQADLVELDRADGAADGLWRGHEIPRLDATPAFTAWQQRVVEAIIEREGFGADEITDLLYVNYKAPDAAGHIFNMIAPEQEDVIRSVDDALARLVEFLDENVGKDSYLLSISADHGQTPLDGGGWPVNQAEVRRDLRARFDRDGQRVLETTTTALYLMNRDAMEALDLTPERIASWLTRYTIGDNIPEGKSVPAGYEDRLDESVFAAVVPGRALDEVLACTRG